jgi:hypothetical protein
MASMARVVFDESFQTLNKWQVGQIAMAQMAPGLDSMTMNRIKLSY